MIGDRLVVDRRDRPFFCADTAGKIAEVVDGQRHIGAARFADRLAVVHGLGKREQLEILLEPVGHAIEDLCALGRGHARPALLSPVSSVQRCLHILWRRLGDLGQLPAVDRTMVRKIFPANGFHPSAANEVAVA